MTQLYEAMFLLDNRELKKGFEAAQERVTELLTKNGAKPRVVRKWDERKLAYEIQRQKRATYILAYFDASGDAVAKLQHDAELSEVILRCLVLRAESVPAKVTETPVDQPIAPQIEDSPPPVVDVVPEMPPEVDLSAALDADGGAAKTKGVRS